MRIVWLVAFAFVLACGGSSPAPTGPVPPAPPPAITAPAKPAAPVTARAQLDWTIAVLAEHHGVVTRDELAAHFHPSFLASVPPEQAIGLFAELAKQLPSLAVVDANGDDLKLVAHLASGDTKLLADLALDPETRKIVGLRFTPDLDLGPKLVSFDDAVTRAKEIAPKAQLLVASVDHDTCKPIHTLASKDQLALGSAFKLYVLLALADQVIAGKLAWDGDLAVRDDWKSLPSGITQNDPAGTKLSIRTFAERMISISDNTATDHLLYTVGRRAAEAAVVEAKHSHPDLDVPFLSTRELFLLKLDDKPETMTAYLKMSAAKRRDYLDHTLAGKAPSLTNVESWTTARHIDRIEWFASAEDQCRVMATLHARAQNPKAAPVLDVLAKNPGLPIDPKVFPYIGFKGGSEPGVVTLTYLLRRDDDKWFVVDLAFNSAEGGQVDESKIIALATRLTELVGSER